MYTQYDEFSGIGGFSDGARFVPGVECADAANHDPEAITQHRLNFPRARHYQEDVTKIDMTRMPRADIFTGSPSCPSWTTANGQRRDFDKVNAEQEALFDLPGASPTDPAVRKRAKQYKRARLLMWEPIIYLRAMIERDPANPVLIGVIENVIQCRLWADWDKWISEFHKIGYYTKLIPFNAMHARPVRAPRVPQSRNRLFLAFYHRSLGRHPDWDKWIRPRAWCQNCQTVVDALGPIFKNPKLDMGSYGSQYVFQCPNKTCAGKQVFPEVVPALAAIDLSNQGTRIGDRESLGMKPLAPATEGRISAGMHRHWEPLLVPVGGTWRGNADRGAVPLSQPAPTRTTRETDGIALPPLLVPVEARAEVGRVTSAVDPSRTMTTRAETGVVMPFLTSLRGGGSRLATHSVTDPAGTVTASGNHHGLVIPPSFLVRNNSTRDGNAGRLCTPLTEPARTVTTAGHQSLVTLSDALLVPYYGAADSARPAGEPCGTLTTRDRYGIATPAGMLTELPDLEDVRFRMLEDPEIKILMGFGAHFRNEARSKRSRVRLYGNAVPPALAEVIISALVECAYGVDLPRELVTA